MFFKIRPDIALYTACSREKSQKVIYLRSSVLSRMKCCVNDYIRVIIYIYIYFEFVLELIAFVGRIFIFITELVRFNFSNNGINLITRS